MGYALAVFAMGYLYVVARDIDLEPPRYTTATYAVLLFLCCGHATVPFLSAFVWKLTVELASHRSMNFREACSIYLRANIAKYLPGNIFHYAGRNVFGAQYGWTSLQLTIGTLLEIAGSIVIPFGILAILALSGLWTLPSDYRMDVSPKVPIGIVVSAVIVIAVVGAISLSGIAGNLHKATAEFWSKNFRRKISTTLLKMTLISATNSALYTVFFYLIAANLLGVYIRNSDFINVACSLTVAGNAGILTPGLPGGIGVRESTSVLLLSGYGYDKASLVAVTLVARVFLVVGDLVAFLIATRLREKPASGVQ